jgi:hypothetical protein
MTEIWVWELPADATQRSTVQLSLAHRWTRDAFPELSHTATAVKQIDRWLTDAALTEALQLCLASLWSRSVRNWQSHAVIRHAAPCVALALCQSYFCKAVFYVCYIQSVRPPLWSCGQSTWLQIQRSGFHSQHYQIFLDVARLEQSPLSLASTTEELLVIKISDSGLENRDYGRL